MLGTFDDGQPKIIIEVKGVGGIPRKMEAIVDSGFNGYLQIPLTEALPVGLVLSGIQNTSIADGSSMTVLVCEGTVCVDGRCVDTTIDVHNKTNVILLGTKLLEKLKATFVLDCQKGTVELK
jgi:predicted aspartyl protease